MHASDRPDRYWWPAVAPRACQADPTEVPTVTLASRLVDTVARLCDPLARRCLDRITGATDWRGHLTRDTRDPAER